MVSHAAAIHDAALKGDIAAITAALDAGAGVDESDGQGTPLYLAVRGGHFAAAKLLIERGADVNAAPTPLGPALMPALAKSNIELINLLLDGGANPNAQRGREAALHIAVRSGCLDCVKALVEAGADVNAKTKEGKTPLHMARTGPFLQLPLLRAEGRHARSAAGHLAVELEDSASFRKA